MRFPSCPCRYRAYGIPRRGHRYGLRPRPRPRLAQPPAARRRPSRPPTHPGEHMKACDENATEWIAHDPAGGTVADALPLASVYTHVCHMEQHARMRQQRIEERSRHSVTSAARARVPRHRLAMRAAHRDAHRRHPTLTCAKHGSAQCHQCVQKPALHRFSLAIEHAAPRQRVPRWVPPSRSNTLPVTRFSVRGCTFSLEPRRSLKLSFWGDPPMSRPPPFQSPRDISFSAGSLRSTYSVLPCDCWIGFRTFYLPNPNAWRLRNGLRPTSLLTPKADRAPRSCMPR